MNHAQAVDRLRPARLRGDPVVKQDDVRARLKLFVRDSLQHGDIDLFLDRPGVRVQVEKGDPFLVLQLVHEAGSGRRYQQPAAVEVGAHDVPVAGRFHYEQNHVGW